MNLAIAIGQSAGISGGWRRPHSGVEGFGTLDYHLRIAQLAEKAKLDVALMADLPYMSPAHYLEPFSPFEPVSLLSAIAARTNSIGLIATLSTTFNEPYNVARMVASLDHISNGRAAWNIVTSYAGAENYMAELPPHAERYRRATEFVEVVTGLWNNWGRDAIVMDKASGNFLDRSRLHPLNVKGNIYKVQGPLNSWQSRQGMPVLVQAGQSEDGRDFAAKYAEVVFATQPEVPEAMAFYSALKGQAKAYGRNPDHLRILTGVGTFVAESEQQLRQFESELAQFVDWEGGRKRLAGRLDNIDLSELELDKPIPAKMLPETSEVEGLRSRYDLYRRRAVDDKLTLRQMIELELGNVGHWSIKGTPEQVADAMIERFNERCCDGFVLLKTLFPDSIDLFLLEVVPILQKRGYFRKEYAADNLRDNILLA